MTQSPQSSKNRGSGLNLDLGVYLSMKEISMLMIKTHFQKL